MHTLIFDLDNTLYSPEWNLFGHIDKRINRFMEERAGIAPAEVDTLRRDYWQRYGVTLQGLIRHHGIDPEEYLHYVHDVDIPAILPPDAHLNGELNRLPHRKVVFTNGCARYAKRVLDALEVATHFETIYDIRIADYQPKPYVEPFHRLLEELQVPAQECILFEDNIPNLKTAKELGMLTVLVGEAPAPLYVDYRIDKIGQIAEALEGLGVSL